jgi:pyruvate dehydrogenase E2 component (dihydrolipoamide acetyltransferase)
MYGIEEFTAIINPPNAAILAVGSIRDVPVVEKNQVVPGKRMKVTLSSDHRVVDGASAAEFLSTLRHLLENPSSMLL